MKKLLNSQVSRLYAQGSSLLLMLSLMTWIGCRKEIPTVSTEQVSSEMPFLYKACWDGWGRTSRLCEGWGLCEFKDCWGWQDPCCGAKAHTGDIVLDDISKMPVLIIKLTQSDILEMETIKAKSPLYVDENIIEDSIDEKKWKSLEIKAGAYPFMEGIGEFGGYKIPVVFHAVQSN